MIPTRHGTLKNTLKQVFFVLQRDGTYVDNHYFFEQLNKQFNPSEGFPRFYFRVLNSYEGAYVPVSISVTKFWAIPQAERSQPFSAWIFVFRLKVAFTDPDVSSNEVLSRHDLYRVSRGLLTKFIWGHQIFSSKLYLEDLGPYASPENVRKGEIINGVSLGNMFANPSDPR